MIEIYVKMLRFSRGNLLQDVGTSTMGEKVGKKFYFTR